MKNTPNVVTHKMVKRDGFRYGFFGIQDHDNNTGNIRDHYLNIIATEIGADKKDLYQTKQQHGSNVHIIRQECSNIDTQNILADGLATNLPNKAIYIKTADCVPIILIDPKSKIIGAAHAGWRGQLSGIIKNVINSLTHLGANTNNIIAIIGPCIRRESYEVGDDFFQEVTRVNSQASEYFFKGYDDKLKFDLVAHAAHLIRQEGVLNIYDCCIDTYKSDKFFSYRRSLKNNDDNTSNNISAVMLL